MLAAHRSASITAWVLDLTFYDAAYAAAARSRASVLATADKALLDAGVGGSPAALATRLGISEAL